MKHGSLCRLAPLASIALVNASCVDRVEPLRPRAAPVLAPLRTTTAMRPSDLSLLEAPARAVSSPRSEAQIAPAYPARVLAVHVVAGDEVEAGAPIVDVVMPEVLEAAARFFSVAPARSLRARRRSELAALESEGLVDRARVFEQEAELASLDATRALALATLRAASLTTAEAQAAFQRGRITLRASIGGLVREVNAVVGEVRSPSEGPFAVVVAPGPVRIEARFAHPVPKGGTLTFIGIDGSRLALDAHPVADTVDPTDGTRLVWFAPVDATRLPGGLYGRVVVTLATDDVVEIDAHALVVTPEGVFVDRVEDAGALRRVAVQVLAASATRAIVRGSLAVGDRVCIEPTRQVEAEEL